ncbi:hypothetical protein GCM10028818_60380 [Spirosoma horti]
MAKTTHPDDHGGSGQLSSAPLSRSLDQLTVSELMLAPTNLEKPPRPSKYPISQEEFDELKMQAEQPLLEAQGPVATAEAIADGETDMAIDISPEVVIPVADPPEDTMMAPATGPAPLAPSLLTSFRALGQTGFTPPDPALAVGNNDVMVGVNTDLAGYSKTGGLNFRWVNSAALFGGVLPAGAGLFDPKLAYDHYAQRFICVAAAVRNSPKGAWLLVAVSKTSNAGGAWWVYALDITVDGSNATNNWGDYPQLGFDTQAIYISTNQFAFGGGFSYAKLRILNKAELYAGKPAHWYDFWNLKNPDGSGAFTLQPCVHYRGTGGNPPAYLTSAIYPASNKIVLWQLDNPIGWWSGTSPALNRFNINSRSYSMPPGAKQSGSATTLATNDTRMLNAIFQNVGGVQRVWTTHTSGFTWQGDTEARAAINWYEIDVNSRTIIQQNTYGASGLYYFFPVIQTDLNRNAFLMFTRSGPAEFGQMRVTGRRVADAAGSLQGSTLVKAGESAYNGGRWGDYFGICRDPDTLRVWALGEYAGPSGQWGTWVAGMRY